MGNAYVITGGDFNLVGNLVLDISNTSNTKLIQKSQLAIDVLEEELGLLHLQEREYALYSNTHTSYSRRDYFLISKQFGGY